MPASAADENQWFNVELKESTRVRTVIVYGADYWNSYKVANTGRQIRIGDDPDPSKNAECASTTDSGIFECDHVGKFVGLLKKQS